MIQNECKKSSSNVFIRNKQIFRKISNIPLIYSTLDLLQCRVAHVAESRQCPIIEKASGRNCRRLPSQLSPMIIIGRSVTAAVNETIIKLSV